MKIKLNCSPHLRMHEITKKLFNQNFLSDVQFFVGGKIIYAHSLELMKRSVVFEEQLEETWGEKKLIPIADCTYENFLEFLRFVYTDECEINVDNGIQLLKLATKYKVLMLESLVINTLDTTDWIVYLFGHCITEKYEMARERSDFLFAYNIDTILSQNSKQFLSLHPDAINEALQMENVCGVSETEIFDALAKWIENYCRQHGMSLIEGRQHFYRFIKKIRFLAMPTDQIYDYAKKYPGLLSEIDIMSIGRQILFGSNSRNDDWLTETRNKLDGIDGWRKIKPEKVLETKFTASQVTILQGFWIGIEQNRKDIEIEITTKDVKTNESENIQFTQPTPGHWNRMLIVLGESFEVRPDFEYTIAIKYLNVANDYLEVLCRKTTIDVIHKSSANLIRISQLSDNMLEMIVKPVSG